MHPHQRQQPAGFNFSFDSKLSKTESRTLLLGIRAIKQFAENCGGGGCQLSEKRCLSVGVFSVRWVRTNKYFFAHCKQVGTLWASRNKSGKFWKAEGGRIWPQMQPWELG